MLLVVNSQAQGAVDDYGNLQLKNDYISVIVNQNEFNKGRFGIDVTGGAPMRDGDNNKPLLYGHPYPWTSYTTIRIDGKNYIFGGKTDKRAGKDGKYGELVTQPQIKDDQIITSYKFEDQIVVTQILNFVKSSTTGLADTVQITYRVTNQDEEDHQVGARVMIDTMLGENDGAPFRVLNQAVTGDALFLEEDIPSFCQAFDELANPKVTAQGTIKGNGLTTPDEVYFADWGSLADGLWSFDFNVAEDFLRKGEFELDSAMALFWQPKTLKAGATRTYVTNYGLGGITIVPGLLSLGVTSPAEVVMDDPNKTVEIVAYLQNTAEIKVEDVKIDLQLPDNLELIKDYQVKSVGDLEAGETVQVMWEVRPQRFSPDKLEYTVKVTAKNTDDNQVSRSLQLVGPPDLSLTLTAPEQIKLVEDNLATDYFYLKAKIKNSGASTAYGLETSLALPPGLTLSKGDKDNKFLGFIEAGETIELAWKVKAMGFISGDLPYSVQVNSTNAAIAVNNDSIVIPELRSKAKIEIENFADEYQVGDYITAKIKLKNLKDFYKLRTNLSYNKDVLEAVYVSRGNLFVAKDQLLNWENPIINQQTGLISGITGSVIKAVDIKDAIVAKLHFRIKSLGSFDLKLNNFIVYNHNGEELKLKLVDNLLNIKEDE